MDFLVGLFAVLALKGRLSWRAEHGVLDRALAETMEAVSDVAEKLRVRPRFRLAGDSLARPASNLARALSQMEHEGVIRIDGGELAVILSEAQAYVELEALPFPLAFAERAAKTFAKRHAVARIRHGRLQNP